MKCDKCGTELISNGICPQCDIPIYVGNWKTDIARLIVRKNYDRVISSLYRALYSNDKLTDYELKMIIDYVMEEYK